MPTHSVQQAHDALLALQPAGAHHARCHLCGVPGHDSDKEVAQVAETAPAPANIVGNAYSEAQHHSLLKSAVESETASLTAAKSELETRITALESEKAATATELSAAATRIDLLEADKATAEAAAVSARTELDEFKAEISRSAQIAELKTARKARVQTANESLGDDFFSNERVQRWAEMSEEAFDSFIVDMTEMAKASKPAVAVTTTEAARESAAFAGGTTPNETAGVSTVSQILGLRRRGAIA
jgi:hypothetical protein